MPIEHLDDEHRELLEQTEALARDVFAPLAAAGKPGVINRELLAGLAEQGVLGRLYGDNDRNGGSDSSDDSGSDGSGSDGSGSDGGRRSGDGGGASSGGSAMGLCLIREGLARHCTEAETAFALQGLGGFPILRAGRPEVVQEWIPRIAGGAPAGFALTEPDAGSDAGALALTANRVSGGFELRGEKAFISNAPDADVYSVFARTTPGNGSRGITAFAVPGDSPGLSGEPITLLSPHPIGRLRFEGVFVPDTHVLGEVDAGWRVAMGTLDLFRPSVGAFAVGMAQAALDAAVEHTARREAFGRPLKDFQAVSHQLAEVATRLQAARLLVHGAATAYDRGKGSSALSAMAKLFATETAQFAVDTAIQVHGALALEHGHVLEHLYREVRAPRIYEGASEIQREIIARDLYRGAQAHR